MTPEFKIEAAPGAKAPIAFVGTINVVSPEIPRLRAG
jgi:hypothetical protein